MKQLDIVLPELPYAVEEAMNRLRVNIKFCGKNTKKIPMKVKQQFPLIYGRCWQKQDFRLFW